MNKARTPAIMIALLSSSPALAQACPPGSMFTTEFVTTGGTEDASYVFPDRSVTVADINNDGFPDLMGRLDTTVITTNEGRFAVLLGNGDGSFTEMPRLESAGHPVDFDGDGTLDIVGPGPGTHSDPWHFYKGNGDGTFQSPVDLPISNTGLQEAGTIARVLDFDGDGNLDLIEVYSSGASRLVIHWGDANGTSFSTHTDLTIPERPGQIVLADLDGDDRPEIIANSELAGGKAVIVWGGFTRTPTLEYAGLAKRIAVGDFDGDGLLDIARTGETLNGASDYTEISYNQGGRVFTPVHYSDQHFWYFFDAADFDQDGDADLAAANLAGQQHDVEIGRGRSNRQLSVGPSYTVGPSADECIAADVNADGMPDLIYTVRWGTPTSLDYAISVALNQCTPPAPCPADLAPPAGVLDLDDITAFIGAFISSDPIADLETDGVFDLADITVFVMSFNTGCP